MMRITSALVTIGVIAALEARAQGAPRAVGAMRSVGTGRVIAIPARFKDSGPAPISKAALQERMFDGPSTIGTLTDYFLENSRGQFTLTGVVTDWIEVSIDLSQLDGTNFLSGRATFVMDAIQAVDANIDFRQYDNDGPDGLPSSGDDDGVVDGGLLFFTPEMPAQCNAGPSVSGITTHSLRTTAGGPIETADLGPGGVPIRVESASWQSAIGCTGDAAGLSTTAHELVHLLFFVEDVYAQGSPTSSAVGDGRRWRAGCWDLMSAGSGWGCGASGFDDRQRPNHLAAWEKTALGWASPLVVEAVRNTEYTLQPLMSGGKPLRVPIGPGQYWEIEYRARLGFDAGLPGNGILIFHVDSNRTPPCPTCIKDAPPLLVEADGDNALTRTFSGGGNKGVASDAFGFGKTRFSAVTVPAATASNGQATTLTIHDIAVDTFAHTARLTLTTHAVPAARSALDATVNRAPLSSVAIGSVIDGGAKPYSWGLSGLLPSGVTLTTTADSFHIGGTFEAAGEFTPAVEITDARGTKSTISFHWVVADLVADRANVVACLLNPAAATSCLTATDREFLDRSGNDNGKLDVGDLRAYLKRNPPGLR